MIRFMLWRTGRRAVFAKGNAVNNVYLFLRGYRVHHTLVGWVMAKWARPAGRGEGEW